MTLCIKTSHFYVIAPFFFKRRTYLINLRWEAVDQQDSRQILNSVEKKTHRPN